MTNPISPRDPDAIIAFWLEEGPTQLPETTRRAIAVGLRSTRQTRRVLDVPWRPNTMSAFTRFAVAATAIVIVAGGALYLMTPRGPSVGGPSPTLASPSIPATPSPDAAASVSTKTIDRSEEDGYQITIPSSWNSRPFPEGLFFSPPAPLTAGAMWVGQVPTDDPQAGYLIPVGDAHGGSPYNITGHTVEELLASVNATYLALTSAEGAAERQVTIDGEPGWVTEHTVTGPPALWIDAVVIHGDRAYNLTMVAPPESADELRATFNEVMASIRWTE